ncbi:MAG TPA: recombinase family protein [Pseudonocardiaceae bacterium]|nr:recombinase family protein [Pseudonocardiaceae bacterium]
MTTKRATPSRAGLYKRISDDREGLELGVTRQDEDLRDAAGRAGDTVVDSYSDNDISASTRSTKPRPEYDRMLADARAGRIDKIWAYTSARLTRRPLELEGQIQLAEQFGIEFAYIRSPSFDLNTANGRMIARMLAAKDANEAEETSERIARKMQQKRAAGEWTGGHRPYGWLADGVTPAAGEFESIAEACRDVLTGVSVHAITRAWNDAGRRTSKGNRWQTVTVRQMLVRARNAGLIEHDGAVVGRGSWPAPVDEDTLMAVRLVLADPTRRTALGNQPRWLGSGLYVCWGCEQPRMKVGFTSGTSPRYRCRRDLPVLEGRRHTARLADPLDAFVEHLVVTRLSRPDAVDLVGRRDAVVDIAGLRGERQRLRTQLAEIDDDRDHGRIDRARWLRRNHELSGRLTTVNAELNAIEAVDPFAGVVGVDDPGAVWFGSVPDRSDGLPLDRRRAILDALYVVTVLPGRAGYNAAFEPECVSVVER